MAVIVEGGAVFLHVPKTGGNWVEAMLRKTGLFDRRVGHKHADVSRYFWHRSLRLRRRIPAAIGIRRPLPIPPLMFCFVRHPITRYESWFQEASGPLARVLERLDLPFDRDC